MSEDEPDRRRDASNRSHPSESEGPEGGVCQPGASGLREASAAERGGEETESSPSDGFEAEQKLADASSEPDVPEAVGDAARAAAAEARPGTRPERVETRLRWEGPGQLVYEPRLVRTGPDRLRVEAKRERRGLIPWGFFGGLLFLGVAFAAIVGAENFYTLWDVLWVLIGLTAGGLMYRFGRRSSLEEVTLCRIDMRRGVFEWPEGAQSGLEETVAGFDEITEVVFGLTSLPVDRASPDVRVDAFALLVRTNEEELIPIVEGSPYKEEVHELAKFVAEETEAELTYVGRGMT